MLFRSMIPNRDLYGIQLQAKLSNFLIALNHQSLLGIITNIRLLQIQSQYSLDCNLVISWPLDSIANCINVTFLEGLLSLCKKHSFSYSVPDNQRNIILGGHTPLRSILKQEIYARLKNFLVKKRIVYKSQLVELITNRTLSWSSFCNSNGLLLTIAPHAWFELLLGRFFRTTYIFRKFSILRQSYPTFFNISYGIQLFIYTSGSPTLYSFGSSFLSSIIFDYPQNY